jgi:serine/threonine protein phosphatase 1
MSFVNRLCRLFVRTPATRFGKRGARAYAVGDIHGRLDLLEDLLRTIEEDNAARPRKPTSVVFLGDFVDRGPDSAGVIEQLRTWQPDGIEPVFLAGNHEEMLLRIMAGKAANVRRWLEFGGKECVTSYGVDPAQLERLDDRRAGELLRKAVPQAHRNFLEQLDDSFRFGDYLFVHAGIRPGVAIDQQTTADFRWIRDPFLSDTSEHGFVVVHGHTIFEEVDERSNRIGIDTGAYRTGVLTALGIEDDARWYLAAQEESALASRVLEPLRSERPTGQALA